MRINFFHFLTQSWNPFNKNTPYTYSVNALNIHDQVIFSVIVCKHAILLSFFSNSCWLTVTSRRTMCTALYSGPNHLIIFLGINHEKRFEESPSRTCMCLALFSWNTVVERTLGYWYLYSDHSLICNKLHVHLTTYLVFLCHSHFMQ